MRSFYTFISVKVVKPEGYKSVTEKEKNPCELFGNPGKEIDSR